MGYFRLLMVITSVCLPMVLHASELAGDCESCHGPAGVSADNSTPTIAGMSAFYLQEAMVSYKDATRPCPEIEYTQGPKKGESTDMCKIATALTDNDVEVLSAYFSQKPFSSAKQAFDPGKAARGEKVHELLCEKCHADGGKDPGDDSGLLAGQWMPYLEATMADYRSGARPMIDKMAKKFEKLNDENVEALLHFYASQQ